MHLKKYSKTLKKKYLQIFLKTIENIINYILVIIYNSISLNDHYMFKIIVGSKCLSDISIITFFFVIVVHAIHYLLR